MRNHRLAAVEGQLAVQCHKSGMKDMAAPHELFSAEQIGAGYGHAFRAAELAYDLGMAHGKPKRHEAPLYTKASITFADGNLTSIPEGYRLFAIDWGGNRWEVKIGEALGLNAKSFQLERIVPAAAVPVVFATIVTDDLPLEESEP